MFCGDTLFAGYRIRSDVQGHQWLGQALGKQVLPVELVNPRFYHLDTCFCPLAPGQALFYPPAFDPYGRKVLSAHIPVLIPAPREEASRFACNAVVTGKNVVMNTGAPTIRRRLEDLGFEVFETALRQEEGVTAQINSLYELCFKNKAFAEMTELQWFLTEQVEEEKTARQWVARFRLVGDDPGSLLDLDRELGSRVAPRKH